MEVNIGKMTYALELLTETGLVYDLSPAVISMEWEESAGELSQRGTFMLANSALGDTWLHAVAKIGCIILVYSDWGEGKTLVYQGKIWEWSYSSGGNKEIVLITYDYGKFLLQSSESYYFSSGMGTKDMIDRIAGDWGVSVNYQWGQTMTHEKKVFQGHKIGDIILSLVEEVSAHCEETAVCLWKEEALSILPQGHNDFVFELDFYRVISTRDKISVNDMVTQVQVVGTAEDEGRTLVEAVVEGNQDFALLQTTLLRDSDKSLEDAIAEAKTYLSEHGSPQEEIVVVAVDLPFLRKGEKVKICAGNLIGEFYVLGVCHHGTVKQMSLTLERC